MPVGMLYVYMKDASSEVTVGFSYCDVCLWKVDLGLLSATMGRVIHENSTAWMAALPYLYLVNKMAFSVIKPEHKQAQ